MLSSIPILLYTTFLFLLTRADLLPLTTGTATRLRTVFQFAIFTFIPPLIMTNELGSLLGISYVVSPTSAGLVPEIGFLQATTKSISTAFTTTTVALLGTFQLLIFLLCVWHITQTMTNQSGAQMQSQFATVVNRERSNSASANTYLGDECGIRGLAWLALALVLGATETFNAFGTQTFPIVLVRRILRVFARGVLLYSLVRGSSDGFGSLEDGQSPVTAGGLRALISNPRLSTLAHLTPKATSFYDIHRGAGRQANANPFDDPVAIVRNVSPDSRVTVLYDQKSAPVLQMRFSGLSVDVPDSTRFMADSASYSTTTMPSSLVGHGGHSSHTDTRSRTISEKRSGPPLPVLQVPERVFLAGVIASQSPASSLASLPPLPAQPPQPKKLSTGSVKRSASASTSNTARDSLEAVKEIAAKFPGLPPRSAIRQGPTQLSYAVAEEDEPLSRPGSTERSRARSDTAISSSSTLGSGSKNPVPAHASSSAIIDQGSILTYSEEDATQRQRTFQSISGEEIVVEAHSALFLQVGREGGHNPAAATTPSSSTLDATPSTGETFTRSPAQITERATTLELERRRRMSEQEEYNWMRRSRDDTLPAVPSMSQSLAITRTPEVLTNEIDFVSSHVQLGEVASPRSPWSAQVSTSPQAMEPSELRQQTLIEPNDQQWNSRMNTSDPSRGWSTQATLGFDAFGQRTMDWRRSSVLGLYEGEFVRESLESSASRRQSTASGWTVEGPHAI